MTNDYVRKLHFELKLSFKWFFRFVETIRIPVEEGVEEAMVAMVTEAATATAAANGDGREVTLRLWEDTDFRSFQE